MRIFLGILLVFVIPTSCIKLPPKADDVWLYSEALDILGGYEWVYFETPRSIDDLLHMIELEGGLLSEGMIDLPSYEFLKQNRKKILVIQLPLHELLDPEELAKWKEDLDEERLNDIYTAMFFKNRKLKNLMAFISPYESPCYHDRASGRMVFFDKDGDPIMNETRYEEYNRELKEHLYSLEMLAKVSDIKWRQKERSPHRDFMIVEYTRENGLRDVCSNMKVDVDGSTYFEAFDSCLNDFMQDHPDVSRIIMDSYIPVE